MSSKFSPFSLSYFKEGTPWFINVTDKPELVIEPEDDSQLIIDSEDKKARKEFERAVKKKLRHHNLGTHVWQAFAAGSAALLLSDLLMLTLLFCPSIPALLSCLGSPIPLSSCLPVPALLSRLLVYALLSHLLMLALLSRLFMPALLSCPLVPALLSLCPVLALLSPLVPALLSHSMLDPVPTCLTFAVLRTFKQALFNKPFGYKLTRPSLAKPFYAFLTLGPLPKKAIASGLLIQHS